MKEENENEVMPLGAVLERVTFDGRRILMGFDSGDRVLQTKSALYRRGRLYLRTQKSFSSEIVAQIGHSVVGISEEDERARLRVTFDNDAELLLGTYLDRSHSKRTRHTTT